MHLESATAFFKHWADTVELKRGEVTTDGITFTCQIGKVPVSIREREFWILETKRFSLDDQESFPPFLKDLVAAQ